MDLTHSETIQPPNDARSHWCSSFNDYEQQYNYSIQHNQDYWRQQANELLTWFHPFDSVVEGSFENGDFAWFTNGKLNAAYNCLDRHLATKRSKVALIWEGDDGEVKKLTYEALFHSVCRFSNALKRVGVQRGDRVCIYMPMIVESVIAMLAVVRIGAIHNVVFAGFSVDSLSERIMSGACKVVLTADEGRRGGKIIPLKQIVDSAIDKCQQQQFKVDAVIVYQQTNTANINMQAGRDVYWNDVVSCERPYCPAAWMDAEDALFHLFTSGSTGKAKGIQHSTAGYLVYTALTSRYTFDLHDDDVHACVADVGWITGHSYIVYGPLLNGMTTLLFESTPTYPTPARYWQLIAKHSVTVFYTSPTAIRALMKFDTALIEQHDLSSLRVLGSVGEPINPEAWRWYYQHVGKSKLPIVDTYWQTETSGHMLTPLPFATPLKPGSASFPFFGIEPVLLDPATGQEIEWQRGKSISGVLCMKRPWPGLARTIFQDHHRFLQAYTHVYHNYYFTGDGAIRDEQGYYWITGRVDDVINVSGHRIGSAEIESALVSHYSVAEAAVIGVKHEIKGQALSAYVTTKETNTLSHDVLSKELIQTVRLAIGPFAAPDSIIITPNFPKTRSGKIMRRLLRKIAEGETDVSKLGDVSTLADETVVTALIEQVSAMKKSRAKVNES